MGFPRTVGPVADKGDGRIRRPGIDLDLQGIVMVPADMDFPDSAIMPATSREEQK